MAKLSEAVDAAGRPLSRTDAQHRANLQRFRAIKSDLKKRDNIVDGKLDGQDTMLLEIRALATEGRDLAKKTNGRVTDLEGVVAPMNADYKKFKTLLWAMTVLAPVVVTLGAHFFDHVWGLLFK